MPKRIQMTVDAPAISPNPVDARIAGRSSNKKETRG